MTSSSDTTTYWSRANLGEALLEAVAASGLDLSTATPDDLAPLEQFHGGGKRITRELAARAEVSSGMQVLDVGGGVGGPARMLAVECGQARGVDFDADLINVAQDNWPAERASFECADVLTQAPAEHDAVVSFDVIEHILPLGVWIALVVLSAGNQLELGRRLRLRLEFAPKSSRYRQ